MRSWCSVVVRTLTGAQVRRAMWNDSKKDPRVAGDTVERSELRLNTCFVYKWLHLKLGSHLSCCHLAQVDQSWAPVSPSVKWAHWDACFIWVWWAFLTLRTWVCGLLGAGPCHQLYCYSRHHKHLSSVKSPVFIHCTQDLKAVRGA